MIATTDWSLKRDRKVESGEVQVYGQADDPQPDNGALVDEAGGSSCTFAPRSILNCESVCYIH
jgi:hypothetical protein